MNRPYSRSMAASRGRVLLNDGMRAGVIEFIRLLPRIGIGVVGSGYIAEVLPRELIAPWLGPESGLTGVLLATLGGALTPGGPVVGFSIGAAALKSGAGAPQVIAYSTAWALYAIHRLVMWEMPMMPPRSRLCCVSKPTLRNAFLTVSTYASGTFGMMKFCQTVSRISPEP